MKREWKVRQYKDEDEPQIIRMREEFSGWGIDETIDHNAWSWRYHNNTTNSSIIIVAENQNKLIGYYTILPIRMLISGKEVLGSRAEEGLVHPEYRKQGIYQALLKVGLEIAKKEEIACIYGLSNEASLHSELKAGWKLQCEVPLLVKKILNKKKINKFTGYKYRRIKFKIRYFFNDVKDVIKKTSLSFLKNKIAITKVTSFDKRVDDLWERYANQYEFIVERKMDYLNWRYVFDPILNNTIYLAEKKGELLGYIVVGEGEISSSEKKDFQFGYILDIFCDQSSKKVISSLIYTTIDHFKKSGVDGIKCRMLRETKYYNMLLKYGFFKYGQKAFIIKSIPSNYTMEPEKIKEGKKRHITFGDGF